MGSQSVVQVIKGESADQAFQQALYSAQHEYGGSGYTGSIAEANGYVMKSPAMPKAEAMRHAENSVRAYEVQKWGPALLIPVVPSVHTRSMTIPEVDVTGMDWDQRQNKAMEVVAGLLREGEVIEEVIVNSGSSWSMRSGENPVKGTKTYAQKVIAHKGTLVTQYVVYTLGRQFGQPQHTIHGQCDSLAEAKELAARVATRAEADVHIEARKIREGGKPLVTVENTLVKETVAVLAKIGTLAPESPTTEWVAAGVYSS
jgi:hypothetical protein